MYNQFILKIAAPMVITSIMLLVMGVIAAWNVQRQQVISSELIQREVHAMIAAQDLCNDVREIRNQLHQYRHDSATQHLTDIARRCKAAAQHLVSAKELIRTSREQEAVSAIEDGWDQFKLHYEKFEGSLPMEAEESDRVTAGLLADIALVLVPAKEYLTLDRMIVDKTNETNRQTTEVIRQTFLLVGICGGLTGLVAGLVIARGIGQSVVQLDVSIRGAAGRLQNVVGPVTISQSGGFRELEVGLKQVESHIQTVVERLRQSELEVLRSDQLAAVGQLAAGVAHELRNPLMPMKMLVQAAVERDDGVGLAGQQLMVVEEEIRRLEKSIQDFLDFARPTTLDIQRFDLRLAIEQTVELLSARADRQRVNIVDDIPNAPVIIEADSAQIRQVILNLLLNSFDALPDGGTIRIEVAYTSPSTNSRIDFAEPHSEWVIIRLSDSGPGLSEDVLGRVFEPFVSTKETGTGLGLSICRRIVEAHGGVIVADNEQGGGAVFSVFLPLPEESMRETDRLSLLSTG